MQSFDVFVEEMIQVCNDTLKESTAPWLYFTAIIDIKQKERLRRGLVSQRQDEVLNVIPIVRLSSLQQSFLVKWMLGSNLISYVCSTIPDSTYLTTYFPGIKFADGSQELEYACKNTLIMEDYGHVRWSKVNCNVITRYSWTDLTIQTKGGEEH